MPISTKKLVYDFHRKNHSILSGEGNDIPLVDVIAYLNEAQEIWYENRVSVAQTNQKVRNDLRVYKVDKHSIECESIDDKCCLVKYPAKLHTRLNQLAIAVKDCCPNIEKEIIVRIIQSDDLHEARQNPFRKSDFFFEQLLGIETNGGIIIYHDGEMDINSVVIDYYRKPNELHAPSLEVCEGEKYYDYCGTIITKDTEFESDTYSSNEVSDIAALCASRDVNDIQGFQTQLSKILQIKDLHK